MYIPNNNLKEPRAIHIPRGLFEIPELTNSDRCVMGFIVGACFEDETDSCRFDNKTIIESVDISQKTLSRALKKLEELGLINREVVIVHSHQDEEYSFFWGEVHERRISINQGEL